VLAHTWHPTPTCAPCRPQALNLPYSTRFIAVRQSISSGDGLYTVPSGYVAVVRDVVLWNNDSGEQSMSIGATVPGPLNVLISQWFNVGSNATVEWQGRQVLNAGDELWAYSAGVDASVMASGYLLSSP
jgi:hypothetical protein